jgi:hypothetical protein
MSDRSAMAALLLQGPLCLACLAKKCGLSADALEQELRRIGQVIVVHRDAGDAGPCRTCNAAVSVVTIAR